MAASKVYFTTFHTTLEENIQQKLSRLLLTAGMDQIDFKNRYVAIKMHFGEPGNLAYLRPNYAKTVADLVRQLGGKPFLTDCNTLYVGGRKNALDHIESAYVNGFTPYTTGCHVIIADGLKGSDDVAVPVDGEYVKNARIGLAGTDGCRYRHLLTHFKGHEATGIGGNDQKSRHGRRLPRGQEGNARRRQARRERVQVHRLRRVPQDLRPRRPDDREPQDAHRHEQVRRLRPLHRRVPDGCH